MSKTAEEKILDKMIHLSNLKDEIKRKIEQYNVLSIQSDNNTRLALLVAGSHKEDYDEYGDGDGDDDEELEDDVELSLTHEDFIRKHKNPRLSIFREKASAWFPSSIC